MRKPQISDEIVFLFFFVFFFTDGLKLCDFGFSRAIEGNRNVCEIQGTVDYVAPVRIIKKNCEFFKNNLIFFYRKSFNMSRSH